MKRTVVLSAVSVVAAVFAWAGLSFLPPDPAVPYEQAFRLPGVTLINPGTRRQSGVDLTVQGGRLVRVVSSAPPAGTGDTTPPELTDYRGHYVLPALADMHAHFPTDSPLRLTEYFGLLYLLHGVTTVRDAGDLDGTAIPAARKALSEGSPMPRLITCGPFLVGAEETWPNAIRVDNPDQATSVIQQLRQDGHGCAKLYVGLDSPRIQALVQAAQTGGVHAIGHVPARMSLEEAGIPDTQHFFGVTRRGPGPAGYLDWSTVTDRRLAEVVRFSAKNGIAHTPTMVLAASLIRLEDYESARQTVAGQYMPRMYRDVVWNPDFGIPYARSMSPAMIRTAKESMDKRLRLLSMLHHAGVPLRIGTDVQQTFVAPGFSVWEEMRIVRSAGIPAESVWEHAGPGAVEALFPDGPGQPVGASGTLFSPAGSPPPTRLVAGAPAEFLVFGEDPTRSLAALESLRAVVARGRLYRTEDLRAAVERFQQFHQRFLVDQTSVIIARNRMKAMGVAGEEVSKEGADETH